MHSTQPLPVFIMIGLLSLVESSCSPSNAASHDFLSSGTYEDERNKRPVPPVPINPYSVNPAN